MAKDRYYSREDDPQMPRDRGDEELKLVRREIRRAKKHNDPRTYALLCDLHNIRPGDMNFYTEGIEIMTRERGGLDTDQGDDFGELEGVVNRSDISIPGSVIVPRTSKGEFTRAVREAYDQTSPSDDTLYRVLCLLGEVPAVPRDGARLSTEERALVHKRFGYIRAEENLVSRSERLYDPSKLGEFVERTVVAYLDGKRHSDFNGVMIKGKVSFDRGAVLVPYEFNASFGERVNGKDYSTSYVSVGDVCREDAKPVGFVCEQLESIAGVIEVKKPGLVIVKKPDFLYLAP